MTGKSIDPVCRLNNFFCRNKTMTKSQGLHLVERGCLSSKERSSVTFTNREEKFDEILEERSDTHKQGRNV